MSTQRAPQLSRGAVPVRINAGSFEALLDRAKEIYQSVAGRAYELFERRGCEDGHDWDDWLRAEQEMALSVRLELVNYDDELGARAEVPGFSEKDVQVSLEQRRLVISGKKQQAFERKTGETVYSTRSANEIFHTVDLPAEVDPEKATATLRDGILSVRMPKVVKPEPAFPGVKEQ